MAILYNIYANDGLGGPVNYATALATTPSLSWSPGPLSPSSDNTFAVRAFDSTAGLEEANTEARVRIIVDASGRDATARPNAPTALVARAAASGGCLASWTYLPAGQGAPATSFSVFLAAGAAPSYATIAATVPFAPGVPGLHLPVVGARRRGDLHGRGPGVERVDHRAEHDGRRHRGWRFDPSRQRGRAGRVADLYLGVIVNRRVAEIRASLGACAAMNERKLNGSTYPYQFFMASSADHVTGVTGLAPTVVLSKNGAAFAPAAGTVSEVGFGWYSLAANPADRNSLGGCSLHASALRLRPLRRQDNGRTLGPLRPEPRAPGAAGGRARWP